MKNSKGFTLVETTMTLFLITIVIAVSSGIIISVGNLFSKNTMVKNAQMVANTVYNLTEEKLKYATSFATGESPVGVSGNYIETVYYSQNGNLITISRPGLITQNILDDSTRNGCLYRIEIDDSTVSAGYVKLTVSVYHNSIASSNLAYTKSGVVPLMNFCDPLAYQASASTNFRDLYLTYSFIE